LRDEAFVSVDDAAVVVDHTDVETVTRSRVGLDAGFALPWRHSSVWLYSAAGVSNGSRDNPLGNFALRLSIPGYLIHGTNTPAGVGMRVSHGCIRLYPEDIEALYDRVPLSTPVYIVDQPVLAGWRDGQLYLEVHPPLAEDERDPLSLARQAIVTALADTDLVPEQIDWERVADIVTLRRGIPFPVLDSSTPPAQYLAGVRVIENLVPVSTEQSAASR